jgi:hypothetical protein
MLMVCRHCSPPRYTLKTICPGCQQPTVKPYGSASQYSPGSNAPLEKLVQEFITPDRREAERITNAIRHRTGGYGIIHTIGRTRFDELGGDGAYARWMQQHFSSFGTDSGCMAIDQLIYEGPVGNIKNDGLARKIQPPIQGRVLQDCIWAALQICREDNPQLAYPVHQWHTQRLDGSRHKFETCR